MAKASEFDITTALFERDVWLTSHPPERDIALMLIRFVNRKNFNATGQLRCWPKEETLGLLLGMHRTKVVKYIKRLIEDRMITVEKVGRKNFYTFQWAWLAQVEKDRDEDRWSEWPDHRLDGAATTEPKPKPKTIKEEVAQRSRHRSASTAELERRVAEVGAPGRRMNGKRHKSAEESFCKDDLDKIDLGPKVKVPGAVLRKQFRDMKEKGYAESVILRAKAEEIARAQRIGDKAWWDLAGLEEMCRDLAGSDDGDDFRDEAP